MFVARVVQGRDDLLWRFVLAGAQSVLHVLSSLERDGPAAVEEGRRRPAVEER
jgi:hypothetical protein